MSYIEEQLAKEHSKTMAIRLTEWIGEDAERMAEFMTVFLGDDYRLTQRAAFVLSYVSRTNPAVLEPHLTEMVAALRKPGQHVAIRRNVIRHFDNYGFPDALIDELADLCFTYLADPQEAVAVRAFSMGVLEKVCAKEPELKSELRLLIEEHLPHGTAGFKSRGKKILKLMN